jgi:LuxR family quorum sensing-dependent transcriptional regulator
MSNIRNFAFDCIDELNSSRSTDDVMGTLWRAGDFFGFENFAISGIPMRGETIDPYILLRGWPEEWTRRYVGGNYVHDDPIIEKTKRSTMPFCWNEVPSGAMTERNALVMNEAREFGLTEGFSIPIYTTLGFQAIVTFGAQQFRPTSDEKAAIHLIGIYANGQVHKILTSLTSGNVKRPSKLSPREIECLKWASVGKSSWEIGMILDLSQTTIEQYIKSAAHKLSATNRVQTVAEAIRGGIIN